MEIALMIQKKQKNKFKKNFFIFLIKTNFLS